MTQGVVYLHGTDKLSSLDDSIAQNHVQEHLPPP